VAAKLWERLHLVYKDSTDFVWEMFTLKKLNEVQDKEQYHVEFSNSFAALEDLDAEVDIKSA
jgi:hypothetical protein